MQVFAVILIVVVAVTAKGSGPYLPSGWRPDGPAFYLPSEVQKPAENPLQDFILAGSEASGSDALREYGPPKIQLPSPVVINQGLPDVAIEQNFIEAVFSSKGEKEVSSVVSEKVIEESVEKSGISLEQSEVTTESQINVEISQVSAEEKTSIIAEAPIVVQTIVEEISERGLNGGIEAEVIVEAIQSEGLTTETIQGILQEVIVEQETSSQEDKQEVIAEQTTSSQEEKQQVIAEEETSSQEEKQEVIAEQVKSTQEEKQEVIAEQATSSQEEKQEVLLIIETIQPELSQPETTTLGVDVRSEVVQEANEQVSNLEQIVQNIPEALANLESAVKSEIEISQPAVDSSSQGSSGSSVQVPEGFLEYGPPGFKEYGPPKEDLNIVAIQGLLREASVETNEARRRRFSPKFKPTKKAH